MRFVKEFFETLPILNTEQKRPVWLRLGLLTVSAVYFYVFMEWLFFVTKPSFMDVMRLQQKIEVLVFTGLFCILFCLPAILILFILSHIPGLSGGWVLFLYAGGLIPAAVLSITSLLMVDNFTYTLFRFGVVSTQGVVRALYGALFLFALLLWYRWVLRYLASKLDSPKTGRSLARQSLLTFGVLLISSALAFPKMDLLTNVNKGGGIGSGTKRPHILLLGGDGINAGNMSVYGYERDTTPNLRDFAKSSLVAEYAYTNSANSPGSIISILTGKFPMNTRVIYPPDILRDSDSYQHMPGILRGQGYRNVEIGVSHYIDVYTLNLREGFDTVNKRSLDQAGFQAFAHLAGLQDTGYFLSVLTERLSDRLQHIFLIQEMSNPYQEVTNTQSNASDDQRVRQLLNQFKQAEQPLFVHVHLMGTHGPRFEISERVFSSGQSQDHEWMTDFYDDAILEFDAHFGKVWSELTKMGVLENTIVIIYSDHPQKWQGEQGIPLIIRFPEGEHTGRITSNVQNLDIAPTILDYMGLRIPPWMEGQSLLAGEPDPTRPIFTTGAAYVEEDDGYFVLNVERLEPPFYQFGYLTAVLCQNWYRIILTDFEWAQGEIMGHSSPCKPNALTDAETAQREILKRLESDGFDTSALQSYFSTLEKD